jgi:DNA-binding transcriptional regulator YiaG
MDYQDALALSLAKKAAKDGTARQIRLASGLPQSVIASVCHVTPQAVTRWERGDRSPTGPAAIRYGRLLRRLGLRDNAAA